MTHKRERATSLLLSESPTHGTPAKPVKCGGSMMRFGNVPTRRQDESVDICTVDSEGPHKRVVCVMGIKGIGVQGVINFTPDRAADFAASLLAAAIEAGHVPAGGAAT